MVSAPITDHLPNAGCLYAERQMPLDRYRNIGIMAHIDAGKVIYSPTRSFLLNDYNALTMHPGIHNLHACTSGINCKQERAARNRMRGSGL